MQNEVAQVVQEIMDAYGAGYLAMFSAIIVAIPRVLRWQWLQDMLPQPAKWTNWPGWVKWLLPIALAFAGAVVSSLTGGVGIKAALIAAIPVAIAAISGHHATKKVGEVHYMSATGKNPDYVPSANRKLISLAVPIPSPEKTKELLEK